MASAESIDEDEARYAVAEFFSSSPQQSTRLRAQGQQLKLRSNGHDRGYYIFDRPEGGVVFVADDDAIGRTVLGYTNQGCYDAENLPVGLQDWLDQVEVLMNAVHKRKINKRNIRHKAGTVVMDPLIQTKWNQNTPYNNLCPIYNGQRCLTGCVATAMAQVMKYWKWPKHGYLSVSYYDEEGCGQTLSHNLSSDYYDWDNMLNSYSSGYTSVQATAVATLMRDCGYAICMKYRPESSSTSKFSITKMHDYFHYSDEAKDYSAESTSEAKWHELIQQDLRANRPVLYSGRSENGRHRFILDGYDTEGYYHVNWGWGGYQDGWFMLTNLNGYNIKQSMINNLKPDYNDNSNINFADVTVKSLCVANWDTNGDGELSYNEAAAVKELGEVFKGNKYFTSFNELQFFTGMKCIGISAFYNCSSLSSVIIPSNVTYIDEYAFYGCSGLTSITIPNSVIGIYWGAFSGCRSLVSIAIPSSVTTIDACAFNNCSSLTSVTIPNSVNIIGAFAFNNCNNLTSITIPNSVSSLGDCAFYYCI